MAGVNKVILIGNLGADPECRTTPNGADVANCRLAVSETWKDQSGQRQEKTEWVNLTMWRKTAEIAQRFLRKGSKIYVEGKLSTRSWDDKETGQKRYATEVVVESFTMLDAKPEGDKETRQFGAETAPRRQPPATSNPTPTGWGDDDLPF